MQSRGALRALNEDKNLEIGMKLSRLLAYTLPIALIAIAGFAAVPQDAPKAQPDAKPTNEVIQTFPSNDVMKTAWKVRWASTSGNGLYIQDAYFKRGPKDPWLQVLGDARL